MIAYVFDCAYFLHVCLNCLLLWLPHTDQSLSVFQTLKQNNSRLENRTQLVSICHMGPKVFINCAGFIMIDTNQLGDT